MIKMDFEILILLVLLTTHLLAFATGWTLRHIDLRSGRSRPF
jgi:hypothetical protein